VGKKLSELSINDVPKGTSGITLRPTRRRSELNDWLDLNVVDLITAVDYYLRTYNNPKREPAKAGGITDRRNKRMAKIHDFLINYEEKKRE